MSKEPYYCIKCKRTHVRGKIYDEHAEHAEGITVTPPVFRGEGGEIVGLNLPSTKVNKDWVKELDQVEHLLEDPDFIPEPVADDYPFGDVTSSRPKRGLLARIREFFKKKT